MSPVPGTDLTGLANDRRRVADSRASRLSALEVLILDRAQEALRAQGASRQAMDEQRGGPVRQTELGDHDTLHRLGLAVHVGMLVPAEAGAAVRLDFLDQSMWLEPKEAKRLAIALDIAALEAVHEDRAARRGR